LVESLSYITSSVENPPLINVKINHLQFVVVIVAFVLVVIVVLIVNVSLILQRRREECERKARRGEMDPRLEFTFQLLVDATGLPRGELMDYIFEDNMVCLSLHSNL
jgi:hypothetical protein